MKALDTTVMDGEARYDVVVVGARCAGAATALLLARAGLRVLCVDRGQEGSDTLSTHALMRGAVMQLRRWGLLDALQALAPPIDTTTFHYGSDRIDVQLRPKYGVSSLYAPRRYLLDALLVEAARDAGAVVCFQTSLVELLHAANGRVIGARLRAAAGRTRSFSCALVVGADGYRSKLAELVGAQYLEHRDHKSGTIYGYYTGLDLQGYHWHFGDGLSAGVIPTSGGDSCVFVGFESARFGEIVHPGLADGFASCLSRCAPVLASQVAQATPSSELRAFAGQAGFVRKSHGPGWALVGDASYMKDPGTSHGITDALRDAEALARAIVSNPDGLDRFQQERDELCRSFADVTDRIASFRWTFAELELLHRELSEEMNREAAYIAGWDSEPRD